MKLADFEAEFRDFLVSRLRPILDQALAGRRGPLRRALAAGLAVSGLGTGIIWAWIHEGLAAIAGQSFPPALFIILSGCSFGSVAGVLVYLVLLKRMLDRLRLRLTDALGKFVSPDLERGPAGARPDWRRGAELFPEELAEARLGEDLFQTAGGETALSEIWLAPGRGKAERRIGILLRTRSAPVPSPLPEAAPVSPEFPDSVGDGRKRRLLRRRDGGLLTLVLLTEGVPASPGGGRLSELNIDNYREFCLDARLCLEEARRDG